MPWVHTSSTVHRLVVMKFLCLLCTHACTCAHTHTHKTLDYPLLLPTVWYPWHKLTLTITIIHTQTSAIHSLHVCSHTHTHTLPIQLYVGTAQYFDTTLYIVYSIANVYIPCMYCALQIEKSIISIHIK